MEKSLELALQDTMEEGDVILQAVAVIVFMDKDGTKFLSHRRSTDLRTWEARGLVEDMRDTLIGGEIWRQFAECEDEI